jgi:hypothetical protein
MPCASGCLQQVWIGEVSLAGHCWCGGAMSTLLRTLLVVIRWWLTGRFQTLWLLPATSAVIASLFALGWISAGWLHRAVSSVVLWSLLALAPLFHSILPSLDALWLNRSIADPMNHCWDLAGNAATVVAAGYHEPSLVFLLGTDTKLLSANMAACYLQGHPYAVAAVSEEVQADFLQKPIGLQSEVQLIDTTHGFNDTKGVMADNQDPCCEKSPWPTKTEQRGQPPCRWKLWKQ